jgi:hypothetical protein
MIRPCQGARILSSALSCFVLTLALVITRSAFAISFYNLNLNTININKHKAHVRIHKIYCERSRRYV